MKQPTIKVNCIHAECPNCKCKIDIMPHHNTIIIGSYEGSFEEMVRCFIRGERLSDKWDAFVKAYPEKIDLIHSPELPSSFCLNDIDP